MLQFCIALLVLFCKFQVLLCGSETQTISPIRQKIKNDFERVTNVATEFGNDFKLKLFSGIENANKEVVQSAKRLSTKLETLIDELEQEVRAAREKQEMVIEQAKQDFNKAVEDFRNITGVNEKTPQELANTVGDSVKQAADNLQEFVDRVKPEDGSAEAHISQFTYQVVDQLAENTSRLLDIPSGTEFD